MGYWEERAGSGRLAVGRLPGRGGRRRPAPAWSGAASGGAATARARAIAWAAALADDPRTVYLDTETTGLGATAEVVDVAVVGADGATLLSTLVRPSSPIPPDATAIHSIRDADVVAAPIWPEVHERLCALLIGRPIVVYNAAFDRRIVLQCGARHGLALPADLTWECAMLAYADFHGDWNDGRRGYRLQKLEVAVAAVGGVPGGHRALGDALACRAVVVGMAGGAGD
jgi:DNA polymerase-3 subunit epsilon